MAYTPTNWKKGDVVTAEKLNHMEDGIDDILMVTITQNATNPITWSCDYSATEIYDAVEAGKSVIGNLVINQAQKQYILLPLANCFKDEPHPNNNYAEFIVTGIGGGGSVYRVLNDKTCTRYTQEGYEYLWCTVDPSDGSVSSEDYSYFDIYNQAYNLSTLGLEIEYVNDPDNTKRRLYLDSYGGDGDPVTFRRVDIDSTTGKYTIEEVIFYENDDPVYHVYNEA